MKIAYIDASSGVSGDMLLGGLIHAGWPFEELEKIPCSIGLDNVKIAKEQVLKRGIAGVKINIEFPRENRHRNLPEILRMINNSELNPSVKKRAESVFKRLACAEGEVHGVSPEEVHFHDVGAVDSILDIVGVCKGINDMGIERIYSSPLRLGSGNINGAHGVLPVPAPATCRLIENMPAFAGDVPGEWTTPTGASLLAEFVVDFGPMPEMTVRSVGWGAGQADPLFPNLLRIFIGEIRDDWRYATDTVMVLETEIDDMSGEYYSHLGEKLMRLPVRDYFVTPVYMKKGRPGHLLTVIVDEILLDQAVNLIFKETTTFGVRFRSTRRFCLEREFAPVDVEGKTINIKVGRRNGQILRLTPEYEDCRKAAEALGKSLDSVFLLARQEAKKLLD